MSGGLHGEPARRPPPSLKEASPRLRSDVAALRRPNKYQIAGRRLHAGVTSIQVSMVNGSRRFDGHTAHFHAFTRGLDAVGMPYRVYTCVDPSAREEFPLEGELIEGVRVPGGGDLEMAVNRMLPVFARRLRSVPGDLVHVNDAYLARLARYRPDVVVTIADLGKLTTQWYPWPSSFVHNFNLREVARVRGVVCITEHVRQEVIRHLGLPPDRVRIVPHHSSLEPGGPRDAPPPATPSRPWNLLYVATDRPHKNLRCFFDVLRASGDAYRGTLLSRVSSRTARLIAQLGIGDRLTVRPAVDDLRSPYQQADVLIFPSLFEGFGLPVLEAMSQGLPVIASRVTSIPEVVGDAGQLVNPENLKEWLLALRRLSNPSFYRAQSQKAFERASSFSPRRTGEALRAAYEAFLDGDATHQGG